MTDLTERKASLRRQALSRRDAMDELARIDASLALASEAALHLCDIAPGTIVSGFLPIRSEIDLRPLMMALADRGARLCVPAILGRHLQFRELKRGAPLVEQGFGTIAPGDDAAILDPAVMLVPLSAFDRRGGRIGYGGGYYDRAIASLEAQGLPPRLVGTGFACQEVADVPMEAHDRYLDAILTEEGVTLPDR